MNTKTPNTAGNSGTGDGGAMIATSRVFAKTWLVIILLVSILFSLNPDVFVGGGLEVVASSEFVDKKHSVKGRIHRNGKPVPLANVWAIVSADDGNRYSPVAVKTDQSGGFSIPDLGVPVKNELTDKYRMTVYASFMEEDNSTSYSGETTLFFNEGQQNKVVVSIPVTHVFFLPTIFFLSILVAFMPLKLSNKYTSSIYLSFLFTVAMITVISIGMNYVSTHARESDILTFGFATLYHGNYGSGLPAEWLFSFTEYYPDSKHTGGFGAPLWVLLLSVLGSGLLTVSLIVSAISNRPDFESVDDIKKHPENFTPEEKKTAKNLQSQVRKEIEDFVQHQFYILFSPIGAVFIYQMLIAADAASKPLTVGIAALGAGATLNILLDKAVKFSKGVLKEEKQEMDDSTKAGKDG